MKEIGFDDMKNSGTVNAVANSDLMTVNYKNPEYSELKKRARNLTETGSFLTLCHNNEEITVYAVSIKEDGEKWAIVAQAIDSDEIFLISPEEIDRAIVEEGRVYKVDSVNDTMNRIIGTSPLFSSIPISVDLEVTEEGAEAICNKDSAFVPMKPHIYRSKRRYYDSILHNSRIASIHAYINSDFLEALLDLDVKGKLIEVNTPEIKALYEEFYMEEMKKKRKPYDQRPTNTKTLKRPKKDVIID